MYFSFSFREKIFSLPKRNTLPFMVSVMYGLGMVAEHSTHEEEGTTYTIKEKRMNKAKSYGKDKLEIICLNLFKYYVI